MMKGAGRDATDKFNEVHKWVNYQGLLEACLVGKLVESLSSEPEQVPEKKMPTLAPPSGDAATNRLTITQKVSNFLTGFCTGKIYVSDAEWITGFFYFIMKYLKGKLLRGNKNLYPYL